MMNYQAVTVWIVIKCFLLGWLVGLGILVVISCIKYKELIMTAITNNIWGWINAILPLVIMVCVIGYLIKALFR